MKMKLNVRQADPLDRLMKATIYETCGFIYMARN